MTECQYCKKDFPKGIKMHEKYCKSKPKEEIQSSDPAGLFSKPLVPLVNPSNPINQSPAVDNHKESVKDIAKEYVEEKKSFLHNILHRNTKPKEDNNPPIIIKDPSPEFRQEDKASESDKIKRFLVDAPLWTKYKPSKTTQMLAKALNPGKVYAPMVFVGENEPPEVLYLPYEPERNRFIIPNKGYYITPTQGLPFFIHKDWMVPLVNAPNLKDRFQLPAHIVESARANGLAEGMLKNSQDFLSEIRKYKYISYGCIVVTILAIIMAVYISYSAQTSINNMAAQMGNMTEVIKSGRGVVLR